MIIDTHTHLYDVAEGESAITSIEGAINSGVTKLLMPNCDSNTLEPMLNISRQYPEHCYSMLGLHPCYVKENWRKELDLLYQALKEHDFVAIGEIGLDFYWDLNFQKEQFEAFKIQIDWALDKHLPIVIHSRSATKACIDVVKKKQNGNLVAIFHCYSGTLEEAKEAVDLGAYLGIGGVLTYKKSTLPEIVKTIGINHLVLETDAPYLAPVPFRGKRNQSSYIHYVAEALAQILNMPVSEVIAQTSINANKIFALNKK